MQSFKILPLILLLAFTLSFAVTYNNSEYILIRINIESKDQFRILNEFSLDIFKQGNKYIDVVSNNPQIERFKEAGLDVEILIEDLSDYYSQRLGADKSMGGYMTLLEINAYVDSVISVYPNIISPKQSIGLTIEGRDIWAFKISDNPGVDEDEPEVFFNACIHAREVITPEVLKGYITYLTENYGSDPEATELVNEREIWFVMVVNPDGYYENEETDPTGGGLWRKNRRDNGDGSYGVDLNRNFGYEWGHDNSGSSPDPSSNTYRGTGPFSEPEIQAIRDFIIDHEFVTTVYYHSKGNYMIYPWAYTDSTTPDHDLFGAMGDSVAAINGYLPGTVWATLSYLANGGSDDWGYGEQTLKNKNFSVTIEVGTSDDGWWPTALRKPVLVAENLEVCKYFTSIAGHIYQIGPPLSPTMAVLDTVDMLDYSIFWSHDDTINPGVIYELVEMQNYIHGVTDLISDDMLWNRQGFAVSGIRSYSAPNSLYSEQNNNLNNTVTTAEPVKIETNDSLKFWTYYNIESDWDYAYVEVSLDGATFNSIPGNITTNSNPNGTNLGNGITGSSGGWVEGLFDLSNYYNKSIFIRFTYITDGYVTEEGIYIDNIYPLDSYGIQNIVSSSIADTAYTFTNRPQGDYFYKVRTQDAEGQWSAFSPIRKTYAANLGFLCGDANGDDSANILDITFMISYLYHDGQAPFPLESSDVNGDETTNILDITYYISYLYQSGPALNCP